MARSEKKVRRRIVGLGLELSGLALVAIGIHELYGPAAPIFVGVALVFIAQGLERGE